MRKKAVRRQKSRKFSWPFIFPIILLVLGSIVFGSINNRTPVKVPETKQSTPIDTRHVFIQTAELGTFSFVDSATNLYVLTLTNVQPFVLQFVTPSQAAGSMNLDEFLRKKWPNSLSTHDVVLLTHDANQGNEEAVRIALTKPVYDRDTGTLTYQARMLTQDPNKFGAITDKDMSTFPENFNNPVVFINE